MYDVDKEYITCDIQRTTYMYVYVYMTPCISGLMKAQVDRKGPQHDYIIFDVAIKGGTLRWDQFLLCSCSL